MRVSLEADALLHPLIPTIKTEIYYAMEREPAQHQECAKESPKRASITPIMRVSLEVNAPHLIPMLTMPPEINFATEREPAQRLDSAKEFPDH